MQHFRNRVLDVLPPRDGRRLAALCSEVDLLPGDVLLAAGQDPPHVYFPTGALVGLFSGSAHAAAVQLAQVGDEGVVGCCLQGVPHPSALAGVVQEAGSALQASTSDFLAEMRRSPALRAAALLRDGVLLRQVVLSAACLHRHELGPRLARWLLATQDRRRTRRLFATHASLAGMLGVRRVGVTAAAKVLQRLGLIDYRRGEITVLDRRGLRARACTCYGTDRLLLATLLPAMPGTSPS